MNQSNILADTTILISHAKEQEGLVNRLRRKLENYPATFVTVAFEIEKRFPFQNFWKPALAREIKKSDIVLLVLSEKWVHSPICMSHFNLAKEAGKKVIAVLATPMDFHPVTPDVAIVDLSKNEAGAIDGLVEKMEDALAPSYTVYETGSRQISDQTTQSENDNSGSNRWKQRSGFWQMQFLTALIVGCSILIYGTVAHKNIASGNSQKLSDHFGDDLAKKLSEGQTSARETGKPEVVLDAKYVSEARNKPVSNPNSQVQDKISNNGPEASKILGNFSEAILTGGGERFALQLALESINLSQFHSDAGKIPVGLASALYSGLHQLDPNSVLRGHSATVFGTAFNGTGNRLVSVSRDGTLRIWDYASRKILKQITVDSGYAHSVSFNKSGSQIAGALKNGSLGIWDVTSGKVKHILKVHKDELYRVNYNSDGSLIATASRDKTAIVWSSENLKPAFHLRGHKGTVWSVSFSPDSRRIVTSSSDNTVRVWNAGNGNLINVVKGHTGDIYSVSYSPDGRNLLTASSDGTVRIWDAVRGNQIKILLTGKQKMLSAAYSPDGRLIAAVGYENIVRVWNAKTFELLAELNARNEKLLSVTFSPQSDTIVTTSVSGAVRLWQLFPSTKALVDEAIRHVSSNCLSAEQRDKLALTDNNPSWCSN